MATTYAVINLSDSNAVLFSQVNQSSAQTMRRNLANTQGLLSYQVEPSFITNGSLVPVETLNHEEALALMATPAWSDPNPPVE
jgi:sulfur relay (sulfurtransferase) DsrF/TusC family protein